MAAGAFLGSVPGPLGPQEGAEAMVTVTTATWGRAQGHRNLQNLPIRHTRRWRRRVHRDGPHH